MVAILVIAIFVSLCWHFLSGEPAYQGKRLSAWIQDLEWVTSNLNSEAKTNRHAAAVLAVRQIGPSGLPFLLRGLRTEGSRWEPNKETWSHLLHVNYVPPREHNARIFAAIEALGSDARSGMPTMVEILQSGRIPGMAIVLRETFGPDAIPYLIEGLTNRFAQVRAASAAGLRGLGHSGEPAMDALIAGFADGDRDARLQCVVAAGRVRGRSPAAVPALIRMLKDPDHEVRAQAAKALGLYGPKALDALPELRRATEDKEGQVSERAIEALKMIQAGDPP